MKINIIFLLSLGILLGSQILYPAEASSDDVNQLSLGQDFFQNQNSTMFKASNPSHTAGFNFTSDDLYPECPVCMTSKESVVIAPCNNSSESIHHACIDCIKGMVLTGLAGEQSKLRCPTCRHEYEGENLEHINRTVNPTIDINTIANLARNRGSNQIDVDEELTDEEMQEFFNTREGQRILRQQQRRADNELFDKVNNVINGVVSLVAVSATITVLTYKLSTNIKKLLKR